VKKEITSQYRASLNMLLETIKKCPESLWENDKYENPYWRIVYHTLFYTSLYISKSNSEFIPWQKHRTNYQFLGSTTHNNKPVVVGDAYSKDEMTEYLNLIFDNCKHSVNDVPLTKQSGFEWLPINKLELHLYNIRHIQHHIGQLIERLHQKGIGGIKWEVKF
jgi:hypothetical protein